MAALATQTVVDAGTKPTFGAAATTDTAEVGNGHNTIAIYKNTDANAKTVTITVPGNTEYGQALPDPVINVAASTGEVWIPLRKAYDAADGTGRATLAVGGTGGVTGVTVAVVKVG